MYGNDNLANLAFFQSDRNRGQTSLPAALAVASDNFDWYQSPMNKMNYENEFERICGDDETASVSAESLQYLQQNAHVSDSDWLTICNLVDIAGNGRFNREQFVYLQHILQTRRRTNKLPVGLPGAVKDKLLQSLAKGQTRSVTADATFTRPREDSYSSGADIAVLESQIKSLESELAVTDTRLRDAESQAADALNTLQKRESVDTLNGEVSTLRTALYSLESEVELKSLELEQTTQQLELKREYERLLTQALEETSELSLENVKKLSDSLSLRPSTVELSDVTVEAILAKGEAIRAKLDKALKRLVHSNEEDRVSLAKLRLE